jgi:hypothetical protein
MGDRINRICRTHTIQKGELTTMKKLLIASLILCLFSVNTLAYGPRGHQLVGAIADRRVARNRALANKIRQLLHVGAEFFDENGDPFGPTPENQGFADQGGNKLVLFTFMNGTLISAGKLHGYWDSQTVQNAFGNTQDTRVAQRLASREPADWRLNGAAETWSEQLANDIMPTAREARQRLRYKLIEIRPGNRDIMSGRAEEKKKPARGTFYAIWAAGVVRKEIHKGGWRLAALLEEVLE